MQIYLPFCGIAISNAQLFAASRKEYDRSRVSKKYILDQYQTFVPSDASYAYVFAKQMGLTMFYFKKYIFSRSLSWLRQQAESVGGKYARGGGCCFLMSVPCFIVLKQLCLWHSAGECCFGRDSNCHKIPVISNLCHPELVICNSCANNVDISL